VNILLARYCLPSEGMMMDISRSIKPDDEKFPLPLLFFALSIFYSNIPMAFWGAHV
jgi:hypothetical protein